MALDRSELAKRVKAARAYGGFEKQEDLGKLMKEDGGGVTDPGLLERPNSKKPPPPLMGDRLRSIAKHTGLPQGWFTEPDLESLFAAKAEDPSLSEQVAALGEAVRLLRDLALAAESEEFREQLEQSDAFVLLYDPSTSPVEERRPEEENP